MWLARKLENISSSYINIIYSSNIAGDQKSILWLRREISNFFFSETLSAVLVESSQSQIVEVD